MDTDKRLLLVCAHPDDEALGAGIQLSRMRPELVRLVHVTDGSPGSLDDAHRAGLETREQYAAMRREECLCAMQLVGVKPEQCLQLGIEDQKASFQMPLIVQELAAVVQNFQPELICTHPYEGGHPDHDACAFAVAQLVKRTPNLQAWEFTSYHAGPNGWITGEFLGAGPDHQVLFTPAEHELKQRISACYGTQQHVLALFGMETELFRRAPKYNFSQAPHPGALNYESFVAGITGESWRALARNAEAELDKQVPA